MPLVSVIIPTYNHEKYIAETVNSVLKQDFTDFELIIVDDGSADATIEVAKTFSDPRITLVALERNQGGAAAANYGISKAAGKYLAMTSSDDVWHPQKLGKQVRLLNRNPLVGAVFTMADIIDENSNNFTDSNHFYYRIFDQSNRSRHEWLNHFFYNGNCLCHSSVMIRRSCFDTVGYYDARFAQLTDLDYWVRLCMIKNIHIIPEKLVRFRVREKEQNASGYRPDTRIRCSLEMVQILKRFLLLDVLDLRQVFPGHSMLNGHIDPKVLPYVLAHIAYEVNNPTYQYFALDTLYQFMNDRELAAMVNKAYGFSHRLLVSMTAKTDVFGVLNSDRLEQSHEQVISLENQFKELEEQFPRQGKLVMHLEELCRQQEQSISELHEMTLSLEQGILERDHHINALLSSRSWRLCKPLRILESWIREKGKAKIVTGGQ